MPYILKPERVEEIRPQLAALEAGEMLAWTVPVERTDYWINRLREALAIARRFPERFPELAAWHGRVRIESPEPGRIQTRLTGASVDEISVGAAGAPVTTHGQEQQARLVSATLTAPTKAVQVVEWFFQQQPTNGPLHVPQSGLDDAELRKLYDFLASRQPRWMMLKPRGADSLTLLPWQEEVASTGAAWTPATQEAPANG